MVVSGKSHTTSRRDSRSVTTSAGVVAETLQESKGSWRYKCPWLIKRSYWTTPLHFQTSTAGGWGRGPETSQLRHEQRSPSKFRVRGETLRLGGEKGFHEGQEGPDPVCRIRRILRVSWCRPYLSSTQRRRGPVSEMRGWPSRRSGWLWKHESSPFETPYLLIPSDTEKESELKTTTSLNRAPE